MSEKQPSALRELLDRYRRVWVKSWQMRKEMDPPFRGSDEIHFLPASLALQENPVHPAPRLIVFGIIIFFVLALLWACFGKIDIVATATGKIVPSGKSKVIQASETSVVKSILVHDGQEVKQGDLLIELDTSATRADVNRLKNELTSAQIDYARSSAMLEAIASKTEPNLDNRLTMADEKERQAVMRWLQGQYLELKTAIEQADAEIEKRTAEIKSAYTNITSIKKSIPITRRLVADYKSLAAQEYIPRHAYLEKQQSLLDQERELAVQTARIYELESAKKEAEKQKQNVIAQTRRAMLDLEQQSQQKSISITQELLKAEQRDNFTQLKSPVDGTVQQLAIHTINGVATAAQPLMVIVPKDQPIEVEAMLENKDVGFVHIGQEVEVKVETFTFTKYGVIHGTVISISNDAIEDEKRGFLYGVRIMLKENKILIGNNVVPISPGMNVTAEIKTDKRRVIEYFLSPLQRHVNESLKER